MNQPLNKNYVLREYQKNAVEKGLQYLLNPRNVGRGGIICAPTGCGKSIIIANIAKDLPGDCLVLQPSKEILEQNFEKILKYDYTATIYSASLNQKIISKLTFATIGSIIKKIEDFKHFKYIIIDECHLVNAKGGMYAQLLEQLSHCAYLGLTATPYRMHHNQFQTMAKMLVNTRPKLFNDIPYIIQNIELFYNGYLCRPIYQIESDYNMAKIKVNSTGQNFDDYSLAKYNQEVNIKEKIAQKVIENQDRKYFLVFTAFVEEARGIADYLNSIGISAQVAHGELSKADRVQVINDFWSGKIRVVVNAKLLTIGFDFPELDCIIIGRPTLSTALYYQMVGRCLRIHSDKKDALIIDMCGNVKRHGQVENYMIESNQGKYWKLMCGEKQLTGVDIHGRPDPYKPQRFDNGVATFGKHLGQKITDIPIGYLLWMLQDGFKTETDTCKIIQAEIDRRKLVTHGVV